MGSAPNPVTTQGTLLVTTEPWSEAYTETQEADKTSAGDKQEETGFSKCLSIARRHHSQTSKHFTTVLKQPHLRLRLSSVQFESVSSSQARGLEQTIALTHSCAQILEISRERNTLTMEGSGGETLNLSPEGATCGKEAVTLRIGELLHYSSPNTQR